MDQATYDPSLPNAQRSISSAGTWGLIAATLVAASTLLSGVVEIRPAIESAQGGAMEALTAAWAVIALVIGGVMATFLIQASLAFRSATFTGEPDAQQIVRGLRKLRAFFQTMGIMFLAAVGTGVLGFIVGAGM